MENAASFILRSPLLVWGPLGCISSLWFGLLAVFSVRVARHGLPHNPRIAKLGKSKVGQFFLEYFYWLIAPIGPLAVRLGIHPDAVTWTSLVLQLAAAWAISQGGLALGGWLLLLGASCDAVDGIVARATGLASNAGEMLDAVVDRWSEMAVFSGFAWLYRDWSPGMLLSLWACAAGSMVSYTRAKGETMGIEARMGTMNRHERAAYLVVACIVTAFGERWVPGHWDGEHHHLVLLALGLIGVFGTLTAMRRTHFLRVELRKRPAPAS